MTTSDVRLGVYADFGEPFPLTPEFHRWPFHIVGRSGGGKSTLLGNLAEQFLAAGEGVLVIDIKDGQLARDVAARTAFPDRLVYVSPGECYYDGQTHFWGFNPLQFDQSDSNQRDTIVAGLMEVFTRLGTSQQEFTQVKHYLNLALYLALAADRPTIITAETILQSPRYRFELYSDPERRKKIPANILKEWHRIDLLTDTRRYDLLKSTVPRVMSFLIPDALRYMLGQHRSTLTIGKWLDEGKLVVVDCASGIEGRSNTHVSTAVALGNFILASVVTDAFARPNPEANDGRFWRLVCDEMDQLAGDTFAELIDKARTRRTIPVMAHQSRDQLQNPNGQRLLGAMGRCPVKLDLPQGEADLYERSRFVSGDEVAALRDLEQFAARLTLTPGLTGNRTTETIALEDWRRPVVEGQLAAAIAGQQPSTRSLSELEPIFRREYDRWPVDDVPAEEKRRARHEMMGSDDDHDQPTTARRGNRQSRRSEQRPVTIAVDETEAPAQAETVPTAGDVHDG